MDRKDYLERMQRAIVSQANRGTVAPEDTVKYNGNRFYPCGYELTFDERGKTIHLAILHDLKANSVLRCKLEQVEGGQGHEG